MEKWFTIKAQSKRRWHFKTLIFFICGQLEGPTYQAYSPSMILSIGHCQLPKANHCSSSSRLLSPLQNFFFFLFFYFWGPEASEDLVPLQVWWAGDFLPHPLLAELLEPPLQCMFVSSFWAKGTVDVTSCLHCFRTHFELEFASCLTSFP